MAHLIEEQLGQLDRELLAMGALIEHSIALAADALIAQNKQTARTVVELAGEARQKERDIENLCFQILLRQQPVARDLRTVSAALKMVTDMERISHQCGDICEIVLYLADSHYIKRIEHLPMMASEAQRMLKTGIDAFVRKDAELARSVVPMDDIVDGLFDIIKDELIELIRADAKNGAQAVDLLMIAKYLERIADHAQNIAEWVEFSVTGIHQREQIC